MVLPAPPRFSTTNGWPKVSVRPLATSRAMRSVLPPGGKGTMTFTGRAGHDWAHAPKTGRQERASAARKRVMVGTCLVVRTSSVPALPRACRNRSGAGFFPGHAHADGEAEASRRIEAVGGQQG